MRDGMHGRKAGGHLEADTEDALLYINDRVTHALEMAAKIWKLHQGQGIKIAIFDYIQKSPPSPATPPTPT